MGWPIPMTLSKQLSIIHHGYPPSPPPASVALALSCIFARYMFCSGLAVAPFPCVPMDFLVDIALLAARIVALHSFK